MKRTVLGMVLGLATIATPAMAATFDLGDLSGVTKAGGESIRASAGTLDSTYNFTLSQSSIVHLTLTDVTSAALLTGLKANLYSVGTTSDTLVTSVGPLSGISFGDWTSTAPLGVGTYKVDIVGTFTSKAKYGLTLSSDIAAPVPGPAGFIVAGAGALVVAARRRRKARTEVLA